MKKYAGSFLLLGLIAMLSGCASTAPQVSENPDAAPSAQQVHIAGMTQAAEQGNAEAQFALAKALETGAGLERDVGQAAQWYRRAAEQGHAPALFHLGAMHARGEGAERDYPEAVRLYRKAADLGYRDAIYPVAYAYENGIGVEKDPAEALKWYRRSAEQGVSFAMNRIARAYAFGELGLSPDPALAEEWRAKEKAAAGPRPLNLAPVAK